MIDEFFRKTLCVNRQSSYWSTYVAKTMSDSVTFGRNDVPVPRRYDLKIIVFSRNVLIQSEVCIIMLHLASGLDGLPHRYKIKKEKKGKETKQNKEQLKWKVEQGILCSQ